MSGFFNSFLKIELDIYDPITASISIVFGLFAVLILTLICWFWIRALICLVLNVETNSFIASITGFAIISTYIYVFSIFHDPIQLYIYQVQESLYLQTGVERYRLSGGSGGSEMVYLGGGQTIPSPTTGDRGPNCLALLTLASLQPHGAPSSTSTETDGAVSPGGNIGGRAKRLGLGVSQSGGSTGTSGEAAEQAGSIGGTYPAGWQGIGVAGPAADIPDELVVCSESEYCQFVRRELTACEILLFGRAQEHGIQ
tara:strand:- start:415 stop:1179 length:765 start_codon:yes stop_codon:yes gene_type:complete